MPEIIKLLVYSVVSVATLFVISKVLGKKQIAQLEFIDYVIGISIGSIAANMATDITGEIAFYHYLIGMATFFLFDFMVTHLARKGPFMKRFFKGRALVIIYDGKINYRNLKKSKLDINDLLLLCREKDYFNIQDIAYAIFETNGTMSIMPIGSQKPTVIEDVKKTGVEKASLPNYLIVDGVISHSGLSEISKNVSWLLSEVGAASEKELKKIILAVYDEDNESVVVHNKTN